MPSVTRDQTDRAWGHALSAVLTAVLDLSEQRRQVEAARQALADERREVCAELGLEDNAPLGEVLRAIRRAQEGGHPCGS